ncbi:CAF1-domain-containing protein [Hypoxylon crocopeplum]|nr:CAF1-domain-containing protein [Hypoxylon crocopeplum]
MDIDSSNLFWMLPTMLDAAQKARFVAIDVEMTGISSTQSRTSYRIPVQDAYTKVKEAVEEFQVLQVGFTFIHYEENRSEYITHTFNCHVSPLLPKGSFPDSLSRYLDRKFTVSARSYNFLRQHGFDFSRALDNGVFYLSREEQRRAEEFCLSAGFEDEHIDPLTLDAESQCFYQHAIKQVETFVAAHFQPHKIIFIGNPYGDKLNGLQVRLIHQIIREEYPTCVARKISSGIQSGRMSISPIKQATEIEAQSRQRANMTEVKRLVGLQIIFEALAGGSFAAGIKQDWVSFSTGIPKGARSMNQFNKTFDFQQCEANLKKNRPILVGHNLFHDLSFIYHTFFEPLPSKVDDFLTRINTLFPRIVDTKYMHRRGRHMMDPDRTLQELQNLYARQKVPMYRCMPPPHINTTAGPHNAGFDSRATAILFIKQTYALSAAKKHLVAVKEECYAPNSRANGAEKTTALRNYSSTTPYTGTNPLNLLDDGSDEMLGALKRWGVLFADEFVKMKPVKMKPASSSFPFSFSYPSSTTIAAAATADEKILPLEPKQGKKETSVQNGSVAEVPGETHSPRELHIIPPWTDDFWRAYGNKTALHGVGYVVFA